MIATYKYDIQTNQIDYLSIVADYTDEESLDACIIAIQHFILSIDKSADVKLILSNVMDDKEITYNDIQYAIRFDEK